MTDLEQAAAELRDAMAKHSAAEAEMLVHHENIERLQALSDDYRNRANAAAIAVKHARHKLCAIAAPKPQTTEPTK